MAQYELSIRDYARIFRKRKWVIIITFVLMVSWSAAFLAIQPEVYQASTTVKLLQRKSVAGLLTEWIVFEPGNLMESQAKVITGFPIIRKVAVEMGVVDETTPPGQIERSIVRLQNRISTEIVGATNIIKITATANDPEEAMRLANTVAEVYVVESLAEKRKQASTARRFIQEQLDQLSSRLKEGEEKIDQIGKDGPSVKMVQPLRERLVNLDFERHSLMQKYTKRHPKVLEIEVTIEELDRQISQFSGQDLEYSRLVREVELNKKLYGLLKEKLEEARITEAQKVEDASIVDPAILPLQPISTRKTVRIAVSGIGGIIFGIALAFILETMDTSIGTIEDVEQLLQIPILGVIPSTSRKTEAPVGRAQRFFDRFRRSDKKDSIDEERFNRLIVHYEPASIIAEAYRNVRTNLKLEASTKTLLITSAGPREGKSSILINLGLTFAQKGMNVLLVSSDLRRPVLEKTFGVKRTPGLNELMAKTATMDDCIRDATDMMMGEMSIEEVTKSPGIGNISLLASGNIVANSSELLESKEFPLILEELKRRYDLIMFDSPPVLSITDASLLAAKVDKVILCYEIGRTDRQALLRAKNQVGMAGGEIAGAILNHIASRNESFESSLYYNQEKYGYGVIEETGQLEEAQ